MMRCPRCGQFEDKDLHELIHLERKNQRLEMENNSLLRLILEFLDIEFFNRIEGFVIFEENPMLPIAPGFAPVFTATPVPASSVPNPATPPTWVSSDTVNAPVSVDKTGLVATVALPSTAVVGTSFTLTVSYTNADGTVATGTISLSVVAAPSPDITSFVINQTT